MYLLIQHSQNVVDGFVVVWIGERAVYVEAVQGSGGAARVPADAEETQQEPNPSGAAPRLARAAAEGPQATKVRHMAVSDTPVSRLIIFLQNS